MGARMAASRNSDDGFSGYAPVLRCQRNVSAQSEMRPQNLLERLTRQQMFGCYFSVHFLGVTRISNCSVEIALACDTLQTRGHSPWDSYHSISLSLIDSNQIWC